VDAVLNDGAEGLKLFTGSFAEPRSIVVMPLDVVRAAAEAAHRRGAVRDRASFEQPGRARRDSARPTPAA
jgi:hypothetical protein